MPARDSRDARWLNRGDVRNRTPRPPFTWKEVIVLVLSRKKNERIVITSGTERIVITVVDIRGDKTRLGCDASPAVTIDREEIDQVKQKEKESARAQ